jgi:hypothetical protein
VQLGLAIGLVEKIGHSEHTVSTQRAPSTAFGIVAIVYKLLCILIRKLQPYYMFPNDNTLLIMLGITLTLVISKFVYKYFELYFTVGSKT